MSIYLESINEYTCHNEHFMCYNCIISIPHYVTDFNQANFKGVPFTITHHMAIKRLKYTGTQVPLMKRTLQNLTKLYFLKYHPKVHTRRKRTTVNVPI